MGSLGECPVLCALVGGWRALGEWAAEDRGLFLALLLCDAGQATEVSCSSFSVLSQCSASCPLPWALQVPALPSEGLELVGVSRCISQCPGRKLIKGMFSEQVIRLRAPSSVGAP